MTAPLSHEIATYTVLKDRLKAAYGLEEGDEACVLGRS